MFDDQNFEDPMARRAGQNMQDPMSLVHQGIAHLNDPNNGLDYEQKMEAIVPLLQAKHFGGPSPMVGSGYKPGSQGQISVPDTGNKGPLGFVNNLLSGTGAARKLGILNNSGAASAGGLQATGTMTGVDYGAGAAASGGASDLAILA